MGKYLDSIGLSHFMSLIKQALAGKSDTGHTHAAGDVTSGTLAIGRIPTGSTSTTVALGNHTHAIGNITGAGDLAGMDTVTEDSTSRTANTVYAAPNGSAGAATFRKLVAADIPSLAISKITNLQTTLDGKAALASNNQFTAVTQTIKHTTANSAASDNGVPDGAVYPLWGIVDKNGKYMGFFQNCVNTDGSIQLDVCARNLGTGSNVTHGVHLKILNSGSRSVSFDDPKAWNSALQAYIAASSATQVNVNTSLYRFLVILFRTNSSTYSGNGTSAATSPLNSTIVQVSNLTSGTIYASLNGNHRMSNTGVQLRSGLATITCGTSGKVVLSYQQYVNLNNGSAPEVGTDTNMALVGVIGIR